MKKHTAIDAAPYSRKNMNSRNPLELGNRVLLQIMAMRMAVVPKTTRYVQYHEENRAISDMPIILMPSRT